MQALENKRITVFGGQQTRPNIHIDDITDLYIFLLNRPDITGIYNAGFENISIANIADLVSTRLGAQVITTASNDPRSYRICSNKLLATGFAPKKTVSDAIEEMIEAHQNGLLEDNERSYNLKWMQKRVDDAVSN